MKKWMIGSISAGAFMIAGCGAEDVQTQALQTEAEEAASSSEEVSGTLSFYTSQPDADAEALAAGFQEAYPGVEVEIFRSGTEEVISRVMAEKEAGSVQADVLLVADAVTFEGLKEEEMLMSYESPEAGAIPEEFVDPDHMYYGTKLMATILAVNTNLVKELPSSWKVLTEDQAAGEAVMPSPLYSGAAAYNAGVFSRTEGFGWPFYEQLQANDTMIVQGNGGVLEAVAGGEKSYGMVVDFITAKAKAEGSPVELVYPEEGVPVITEPVGIMSETDNKAAAEAFVDFVLSEEGQQLSAKVGYTPVREGVEVPEGLRSAADLKVLSADTAELANSREEDKDAFRRIFGDQ